MLNIGQKPMIWHVMRIYAHYGFKRFVLCMGYRSDVIREYFLNFHRMSYDATVHLSTDEVMFHTRCSGFEEDWTVTLAYTGELTMTGGRICRAAENYLGDAETFAVTYGDGVTDANLAAEYRSHLAAGRIGTVLGVAPPSRFGEFRLIDDEVVGFVEKPDIKGHWINGGFFFFNRRFMEYLSPDPDLSLEREPLSRLAEDRQLQVFRHEGGWACMDTLRDVEALNKQWTEGRAFWAPENLPAAS